MSLSDLGHRFVVIYVVWLKSIALQASGLRVLRRGFVIQGCILYKTCVHVIKLSQIGEVRNEHFLVRLRFLNVPLRISRRLVGAGGEPAWQRCVGLVWAHIALALKDAGISIILS